MTDVNSRQVGGAHYRSQVQHWDFVEQNGIGYLEGCASKYVTRWRGKHNYPTKVRQIMEILGFPLPTPHEDLAKAVHYVEKAADLARKGLKLPRRHATVISVADFVEANKLDEDEALVIDLLANWEAAEELDLARIKIEQMVRAGNPA